MMHFIDYSEFKKTTTFFALLPCRANFWFIITVCAVCVTTIVFAYFAPMDDIVKTSVILRPQEAVSSVRCVHEGELQQKLYTNGQYILEGELLFNLDTSSLNLELESSRIRLAQIITDIQIFSILLQTIKTGILPAEVNDTEEYKRSASYVYDQNYYQTLIADLSIKLERELNKPKSLLILETIQDLRSEYDKTVLQYNSWKNARMIETLERLKALIFEKNTTDSRISELERVIKNATLYAPISGWITEVKKLNVGDYIFPGEEIIRIVPDKSASLKAEIIIDPAYIARVSIGDEVKIRFSGLPPSQYGQLLTNITLIPPDCSMTELGLPMFIAEAEIHEPWLISKKGEKIELLSGITAEGRIITEKSTIMCMVLRKLDFLR